MSHSSYNARVLPPELLPLAAEAEEMYAVSGDGK